MRVEPTNEAVSDGRRGTWMNGWTDGRKIAFDLTIDLEELPDFSVFLFLWQQHTAGESVPAPIRLVTTVEGRVGALQIIKSLMLAQCY